MTHEQSNRILYFNVSNLQLKYSLAWAVSEQWDLIGVNTP